MQEKDCYEILGTSRDVVYNPNYNWNEAERDRHIKRHYDGLIKKLESFLRDDKNDIPAEKRKEWEEKLEECKWAYPQVASEEAREKYEKTVEFKALLKTMKRAEENNSALGKKANEEFRKKYKKDIEIPPHLTLDIPLERLQVLSVEERILLIENKKKRLIEGVYQSLQNKQEQEGIKKEAQVQIQQIEEAYQKMKEELILEKIYNHKNEYNPNLIRNRNKEDNSLQNKSVLKREEKAKQYFCEDRKNRNLKIRTLAYIGYQSSETAEPQWVYEYEVERTIGEEKNIEIVYSSISIGNVIFYRRENQERYHFVVNKLFSEKVIKQAIKYNEGFIGGIGKDKEGKYCLTIEQDELPPKEQKMLTAIMIQKQKEKEEERGEK